jgi:repressor LexA
VHPIQQKLLDLSTKANLAKLTLREMASRIGLASESPQKIKHHLQQLQKKGLLVIDRATGTMSRASTTPSWSRGSESTDTKLFSIPIVGAANCGAATLYAEQNIEGILRVSGKLVGRSSPRGLYALKADGASMNRARVGGKSIDDGDYVIVDSNQRAPKTNDVVVAILDSRATIKRFIDDRANEQVVLKADSSFDYEPIHLHPDDDFSISGKAIAVIKKVGNSDD